MHISDGLGTYLDVQQEGQFVHLDARANLTVLGLSYVVLLAMILVRLRRKK